MFKRKIKIIDRTLQIPVIIRMLIIFVFIFSVFAIGLGFHINQNNELINKTTLRLTEAVSTEHNIVNAFVEYSRKAGSSGSAILPAYEKILKDHNAAIEVMNNHVIFLKSLSRKNKKLLYIFTGWVVFMMVFLFLVLLRITHRIAGPLYLISNAMDDIKNGITPEMRPLRKGDLCQDLYSEFVELADILEEKQHTLKK